MSLLDKFAVVEIKVDARISEQDKQFCERQQAAYTAALHGFQELTFFWEDMLSAQKTLLGEPDSPPRAYNQYLIPDGDDGPKITIQRLRVQIDTLHRRFIQKLTGYFRSVYNITVEEKKIISELLLPKPPKSKKQALKEYLLWASSIQLHYEDIVTQIPALRHCCEKSVGSTATKARHFTICRRTRRSLPGCVTLPCGTRKMRSSFVLMTSSVRTLTVFCKSDMECFSGSRAAGRHWLPSPPLHTV